MAARNLYLFGVQPSGCLLGMHKLKLGLRTSRDGADEPRPNIGRAEAALFWLRDVHAAVVQGWLAHVASRPFDLNGGGILVFAPHQDDETFGCGGLIAMKRALGAAVRVVFLTGGERSHAFDRRVDTARLGAVRRREALDAAVELGLADTDLRFLSWPDGLLRDQTPAAKAAMLREMSQLVREFRPSEVYLPHEHDVHADHEAVFSAAREAVRDAGSAAVLYQYAIWMSWRAPLFWKLRPRYLRGARRLNIGPVLGRKRAAMAAYASQRAILPRGLLRQFERPWEIFFECASE